MLEVSPSGMHLLFDLAPEGHRVVHSLGDVTEMSYRPDCADNRLSLLSSGSDVGRGRIESTLELLACL